MGRLSGTLASAVAGGNPRPIGLVRLDLPTASFYLAERQVPALTYNGDTYVGDGTLLGVSPIGERADGRFQGVTINLAATDELLDVVLANRIRYSPAEIAWAFVDENDELLDPPESLGAFLVSTYQLDAEARSLAVQIESVAIRLKRTNVVLGAHNDQQGRYPGDTIFKFTPIIDGKEFAWGGLVVQQGGGGGIGGMGGSQVILPGNIAGYEHEWDTFRP